MSKLRADSSFILVGAFVERADYTIVETFLFKINELTDSRKAAA